MKLIFKIAVSMLIANFSYGIVYSALSERDKDIVFASLFAAMDQDERMIKQKSAEIHKHYAKNGMKKEEANRLVEVLSMFDQYIKKHKGLLEDLQRKLK